MKDYDTLIAGGCSFSHDYKGSHPTWVTYLTQSGRFKKVLDCTCPGAGNRHIHDSVMWQIEKLPELDFSKALVIIMWSGYDRDDFIVSAEAVDRNSPDCYDYDKDVGLGMTGGILGESNLLFSIDVIKKIKNNKTRSIENYLFITSLYHYLHDLGVDFIMTEFHTPGTYFYDYCNFDPCDYLDPVRASKFRSMVRELNPNLGDFAVSRLDTHHHPRSNTHQNWTNKILMPYIEGLLTR